MNVYLLERIIPEERAGQYVPIYDCADGFVVAALDEGQARLTVVDEGRVGGYGDEGRDVWLTDAGSTIKQVGVATGTIEPYVILRDFHAG